MTASTYDPKPNSDAVYRIKVLDQDLYVENVPGDNPHVKVSPLQASSRKQKWKITRIEGKENIYHIACVEGNFGLASKNVGYGSPMPQEGDSSEWVISPRTSDDKEYSKIFLNGRNDPFDSNANDPSGTITFFYDHDSISKAPNQCYVFEETEDTAPSTLDIMFLQDATASQSPYIDKARSEINRICRRLVSVGAVGDGKGYLRMGLIAFRDHPPQDKTFVTQEYAFTTSTSVMASNLKGLSAHGGGDGPESVTDALHGALNAKWREDAMKIVILVTDAPPHGLGERGDGFPNGCPCQHDPVFIADQMTQRGIVLFVVACEPTLSQQYTKALDFYTGITQKTGGKVLPLGNTQDLADIIVGSSTETVELENLLNQHQNEISADAEEPGADVNEISAKIYSRLQSAGAQVQALNHVHFYSNNALGAQNAQKWFTSSSMAHTSADTAPIYGNRIAEEYKGKDKVQNRKLAHQPIAYEQVESMVRKGIARSSAKSSAPRPPPQAGSPAPAFSPDSAPAPAPASAPAQTNPQAETRGSGSRSNFLPRFSWRP